MKLLLIGRSAHADVVIPDASVSAYHVEAVITAEGGCYLTDRASAEGTFHRASSADSWAPLRQGFVDMSDQLRLGNYICHVADLLAGALEEAAHGGQAGSGESAARSGDSGEPLRAGPRGAVERDPVTGEIVRRRF